MYCVVFVVWCIVPYYRTRYWAVQTALLGSRGETVMSDLSSGFNGYRVLTNDRAFCGRQLGMIQRVQRAVLRKVLLGLGYVL